MTAEVVKDNVEHVLRQIKALAKNEVLIGIPDETAGRQTGDAITNAAIGYIQETGSPINNIPARPFLVPGVEASLPVVEKSLKHGAKQVLRGIGGAIDKALNKSGLQAQNSVRATINSGIDPALAESTLAARKRRGRTGTKPLIDTGQLRNAITYVIRKRSK
ncbi:hypothetical protein [Solilutibacter silvestris]|uniref:hypothetical protein n=1 Tax=Solilutibacter silvestris TaxID=1645665 RepID=UPI003D32A331